MATLRRLRDLPAPDLLLPGHPSADPSPQSPALPPGRWGALLDAGIRDMETLLARREADGAGFLDGEPKVLRPGLYYLGGHRSAAVYGFAAGSRFVLVDAPGGAGLLEFVAERLARLGQAPRAPDAVLLTGSDAAETAGLAELVGRCRPTVVAPPAGLDRVRPPAPPARRSSRPATSGAGLVPGRADPPARPGFDAGRLPAALGGKSVLFSGRFLARLTQETGLALFADFREGRGDPDEYLAALEALRPTAPGLWLPANPTDGQEANLYDLQWPRDLDDLRDGIGRNRGALGPSNH